MGGDENCGHKDDNMFEFQKLLGSHGGGARRWTHGTARHRRTVDPLTLSLARSLKMYSEVSFLKFGL